MAAQITLKSYLPDTALITRNMMHNLTETEDPYG